MRAKFRELYDRKMGETRRERLLFIVREQAWISNVHNFWVRHALGLMLTLLDTDRRLLMAKTACQGVPVVPLEARPADAKPEAALEDVSASIKTETSGRSASGPLEPLGPAPSDQMPDLLVDGAAPELSGRAHVRSTDSLGRPRDPPARRCPSCLAASQGRLRHVLVFAGQHHRCRGSHRRPPIPRSQRAGCRVHGRPCLQEMVKGYTGYLHKAATVKVSQLVTAIYECGCADDRIARHLFVCIFPMLWVACEQQDQLQLARPVVHLLTKMSDKAFDEPAAPEMHPSQSNRAVASSKVPPRRLHACLPVLPAATVAARRFPGRPAGMRECARRSAVGSDGRSWCRR